MTDFDAVAAADELEITTIRPDGTLRPWVPIWVVRVGDQVYVRSYRGPGGAWYRYASEAGQARVRAGGVELDVTAEHPAHDVDDTVDAAYRAKYARFGRTYLDPMLAAKAATLRLTPR